jgi:hypothetical protein
MPRDFENRERWRDENQRPELEGKGGGTIARAVQPHPLSAVLTGFGFGLGFGLGLTLLLTRRQPTWFEQNVPESIQHLPEQLKRVPNSLSSYVPSSWKQW